MVGPPSRKACAPLDARRITQAYKDWNRDDPRTERIDLTHRALDHVDAAGGHTDPVGHVALGLVVILIVAKLGGDLAVRLGQPAVLGELIGGVAMGNLPVMGFTAFDSFRTDPSIDMLSRLGVLILLFEVGLESTVSEMMKVGLSSLLVAILGVVTPFALGWGVGLWLLGVLGRGVYRLSVGIGMIPRGEVGLIFANIGLTLAIGQHRIVNEATFSAAVVMVIVTTMVTPPALKWSLGRVPRGTEC